MPKTIIKIKTWSCTHPDCPYHQDFEPTAELMAIHWPGVPANTCPNYKRHKEPSELIKETDPNKKTTHTIMGEEDIEPQIVKEDAERTKKGEAKMTDNEKMTYRANKTKEIQDAVKFSKELEDK